MGIRYNRRYVGKNWWKCFVIGGPCLFIFILFYLILLYSFYVYIFFSPAIFCNLLTTAYECMRTFMLQVCVFVTREFLKAIKMFKKIE